MTISFFRRLALGVAVFAGLAGVAQAETPAEFYKGKNMLLIVGYGAGGGYDAYARMVAPYLSKVTGANVIVTNQPGAGGLSALNRAYTATDQLTMMIVNGTAAGLSQIVDEPGVRYDLGKFGYLGIVSASPWIWLVNPDHPIVTNVQEAMKPGLKIRWSASGPIDGLSDGAAMTCAALKLDCQIIIGYKGSNEAALAVSRGEMDSIYVSDTSANNYVKAAQNKAVAAMGRKRSRFFPDLPTIFEQVQLSPEATWWFDFRATVDDLGRILVMPPGMPPDRLKFWQDAVAKVLKDPQLIADGDKSQRYIDFQDPETTLKKIHDAVSNLTPEQKAQVKQVLSRAK
ncbi:MAG TPA: tripartite tricarboxylate transporter substrate-binding protein [Alphaproteobacteria bacterium]|jgi:tripartite-type tricarboxylate transporter receptor subunit TctC|nr:tripartite tricarboxylate transporter substrate-binding protein [Alphaproteobacteria bacterium]